jgi:hypothetical protein
MISSFFIFVASFLFLFIFPYFMVWGILGYVFGYDYISYGLILLRFWVCVLIIMARESIFRSVYYPSLFISFDVVLFCWGKCNDRFEDGLEETNCLQGSPTAVIFWTQTYYPTQFPIHGLISGPEERKTKEISIVQFPSHFTLKVSVTKFKVKLFSFAASEFAFEDSYRTSNHIPFTPTP